MRELLKRLDRLEQATPKKAKQWRIIRPMVGAQDGRPAPWRPEWARCDGQSITRANDESPEAFEARALAHFTGNRIVIGGTNARTTATN